LASALQAKSSFSLSVQRPAVGCIVWLDGSGATRTALSDNGNDCGWPQEYLNNIKDVSHDEDRSTAWSWKQRNLPRLTLAE